MTTILVLTTSLGIYASSRTKKSADMLLPVRPALQSITAEEAQAHVEVLASDDFEGRESGTKGQKLAAEYLAKEFRNYGLQPAGGRNAYQDFKITRTKLKRTELEVWAKGTRSRKTTFSPGSDFIPFSFTGDADITAPVVFAGYGITALEYGYDDYEDIDVTGKIVLVFRHEPEERDRDSRFAGTKMTEHAFFSVKAQNAQAHGAVGMLLVTDPLGSHKNLQPEGYWPSLYLGRGRRRPWALITDNTLSHFPAAWVSEEAAKELLSSSAKQLDELQELIDTTKRPHSFDLPRVRVRLRVDLDKEIRQTQNVMALLEGSHPTLKEELVVLGAHYDHLGKRNGRVFNGADDNASGTAGLLEIAEAYGQTTVKPLRSILFIAFTGEEMGLLGSEYYVKNPVYDLDQTVFMLNLDMIGRNDGNEVTVIGSNRSPEVHLANLEANEEIGFNFRYNGEKFFYRSDHANFAKHRIPIIFYNSEVHSDYHRISDTAEKINPKKLARISQLAFLVTWKMANATPRPTFKRFRINKSSD
ncbi:M20/M25/M40 family metallo-hydrolase [bacterium]|nr:M20/M25/M40 family metallo-hydrolase [bacterium]